MDVFACSVKQMVIFDDDSDFCNIAGSSYGARWMQDNGILMLGGG